MQQLFLKKKKSETPLMKKGQLTIFFMIGLVLLFAVALLFFARGQITSEPVDTRTTPQAEQYLLTCMNNALFDWLDSLLTNDDIWLEARNPEFTIFTDFEGDPSLEEIWGYSDIFDIYLPQHYPIVSSIFGINTMQALCNPQGPNGLSQTTNPHCKTYASNSLQEQLTNNISSALIACQQEGVDAELGVDISLWNLELVETVFSRNSILLRAIYEETLIEQSQQVRLMNLYNFIEERLRFTSRDPRIRINNLTHAQESQYFTPQTTINQETTPGGFYNMTFVDSSSQYRGSSLSISFLVEERSLYTDADGTQYDPN